MTPIRPDWRGTGSLSTMGLEVALSIVLPLVAGNWADGRFHTGPWLALLGFGLGLAAAIRALARGLREMRAIAAKEEREQGNPSPTYPYAEKDEEKDRSRDAATDADRPEKKGDRDG